MRGLMLARSSGDENEAKLDARSLVRRRERSARSLVKRRERSEAWCSLARPETRAKRGLMLARSSGDESEAKIDARVLVTRREQRVGERLEQRGANFR